MGLKIKRVIRFSVEFTKWALHGFPIRNKEEMADIFEICEDCPEFERYAPGCTFGTCKVCGCNLDKEDRGRNKIAWATTRCPLKKWR
jgi:hypothetical protein